MKTNPVYKREMTVSARSFRLALVLLAFNGVLALVALLNMYSTLAQVHLTAEIQYTSFLDLYLFVAVLEFAMLVCIMPAVTAGSISGERERQTLELMLTTRMRPWEIVTGKLMAAVSTMFLLIISSFPILALVFVYGGVTFRDVGILMLSYAAAALFMGSLGLFCSSVFSRTTLATVASYGIMAAVVAGTFVVNQFAYYVSGMYAGSYLASAGQAPVQASSGGFLYLLLINPVSTFLLSVSRLTGRQQVVADVAGWFGEHGNGLILSRWVGISIGLQLILAAALAAAAVKMVERTATK
ncbi:MAG: ABC transporter permease [Eubacteriales bacterium]|nr:ABC transporter permease [Eubacteriales bacterium]